MTDFTKAIRTKAIRAMKSLWTDKVTITATRAVKVGHITSNQPVTLVKDEPAKVILKSQSASQEGFYGTDSYDAELLIRTGLDIPAGAVITVTDQNGVVTKYKRSSKGYSGYATHQEIAMIREEKA